MVPTPDEPFVLGVTAPPPRHPWRRRKRTWAALALWPAVAYPLSVGPAYWLWAHESLPPALDQVVLQPYAPLGAVASRSPLARACLDRYIGLWVDLGDP